jgi:hypothetical protein
MLKEAIEDFSSIYISKDIVGSALRMWHHTKNISSSIANSSNIVK